MVEEEGLQRTDSRLGVATADPGVWRFEVNTENLLQGHWYHVCLGEVPEPGTLVPRVLG